MGTFLRCSQSTAPHTPFFSGYLASWVREKYKRLALSSSFLTLSAKKATGVVVQHHFDTRELWEREHINRILVESKKITHKEILFHTSAYLNSGEGYRRLWKLGGQQQKYAKWGEKAWGIDSFQKQRLAHEVPCFWFTETGRVWERCVGKVLVWDHEFCAVTSGSKWDHISGRSVDGRFGAVL